MEEFIIGWVIPAMQASPWGAAVGLALTVIGTLYTIARALAPLTPTDIDDQWVAWIEKIPFLGAVLKASASHTKFIPK